MAQILGKEKSLTMLEATQLFDLQFTTKLLKSLFLDTCDILCEEPQRSFAVINIFGDLSEKF